MIWSDCGVVLSSKKHGEKYKLINIFTKEHGKISGMMSLSKQHAVSVFSNVHVDFVEKTAGALGFWRIKNEKQNWVLATNKHTHILACQSMCFILDQVLSPALRNEHLFDFVNFFVSEFHKFSHLEILNFYAHFEIILLKNMGYGFDLSKCSICGKDENVHYISPKTGHSASKACLFDGKADIVDLNKLFAIPDVWASWMNNDFSNVQKQAVLQSLGISGYFIDKNILQVENYFRGQIVAALSA